MKAAIILFFVSFLALLYLVVFEPEWTSMQIAFSTFTLATLIITIKISEND